MYILCVGGKLVFGWLCGSSSISKPNQERRNWRESFLFLVKYIKIFCASQIVRSRSRKRERIITEEKASHPSWSSAITRKYGVVPKPFLLRPHCPPLSPPFPPFPPNPVSSCSFNTPQETQLPALFTGGVFSLIGKSAPGHVLSAYRGMCKTRDDYLSGKKTIAWPCREQKNKQKTKNRERERGQHNTETIDVAAMAASAAYDPSARIPVRNTPSPHLGRRWVHSVVSKMTAEGLRLSNGVEGFRRSVGLHPWRSWLPLSSR